MSQQFGQFSGAVSPVWAPTGLALAALLLLGRSHWVGVLAGAFAAALSIGAPFPVALGTAAGSAVESLLGASLLAKAGVSLGLGRPREVVLLLVLGGAVPVAFSATIGLATYWAGGMVPGSAIASSWVIWWTANVIGVFVFTPALLVWSARPRLPPGRGYEALGLVAGLVLSSLLVFTDLFGPSRLTPVAFLLTPFLIWAALRFGQPGATACVVVAAVVAVLATAAGKGPFSAGPVTTRLTYLDLFLGVQSAMALVIAATDQERRAAIRLRDDFLSIASHELRTPLTPLKLSFQALGRIARVDGKLSPERLRASLESATRQIDRLGTLVDNLLDASRLNSGNLELKRESVDLTAVVGDAAERFAPQFAAAGSKLSLQAEPQVVGAWDRMRVEQVITNLLSNALKFGAGKPIDVSLSRAASRAVLEVRDRGCGVAPGDQERIFGRYERAGDPATRIAGLGLGLFISREIVDALGGSISVSSEPGSGAAFRVELPLDGVARA